MGETLEIKEGVIQGVTVRKSKNDEYLYTVEFESVSGVPLEFVSNNFEELFKILKDFVHKQSN